MESNHRSSTEPNKGDATKQTIGRKTGSLNNDATSFLKNSARLEKMEVCDQEEGQLVASEGELTQGLMIPLIGKIEIFSRSFEESIASGTIQPYRSANTYAALRNIPFHYSVRFK